MADFFQEPWQEGLNLRLSILRKSPHDAGLIFALAGGILFGFGSQLGRGCTSGSALSGMAVLSLGGFITMMAIFGTAYRIGIFFQKKLDLNNRTIA